MTNDEIKELLRDLAQKAEEEGEVKSKKIRISLTPEQPEEIPEPQPEDDAAPEKPSRAGGGWFASLKGKLSSLRRPKGEDGETAQEAAAETSEESTEEITEEAMEESMEESAESSTQEAAEADVEKAVEEEEPVAEEEFFDEPDGDGTVYLDQDDDTPGEETASGRAERSSGETDDVEPAPAKKKAKREKRQKKRQFSVMEPEVNRRGELVEPADFESDEAEFLDDETHKEMERAVMQQKGTIRQRTNAVRTALKGKGIGTKELIMIAAGILLCLLIAAVVLSVIGTRRKSANVTTDEGLTVTVEKEPAKWCTHGDVVLGIRTNSPIQSVLVNGNTVDYTGSTKTQIALDANTDTLELMVVTEAEVMNASVKLEKIDAADPQIAVSIQDGKVHLDATDDASGVDALWYGIKEAFLEVPLYQPYTEPFEPESGKQYAYFAVDHAGNATDPVVTTLTPATALTVPATEYSLFPGETADLQIAAEPAGGFINGLQITSDNEEAVVVQ